MISAKNVPTLNKHLQCPDKETVKQADEAAAATPMAPPLYQRILSKYRIAPDNGQEIDGDTTAAESKYLLPTSESIPLFNESILDPVFTLPDGDDMNIFHGYVDQIFMYSPPSPKSDRQTTFASSNPEPDPGEGATVDMSDSVKAVPLTQRRSWRHIHKLNKVASLQQTVSTQTEITRPDVYRKIKAMRARMKEKAAHVADMTRRYILAFRIKFLDFDPYPDDEPKPSGPTLVDKVAKAFEEHMLDIKQRDEDLRFDKVMKPLYSENADHIYGQNSSDFELYEIKLYPRTCNCKDENCPDANHRIYDSKYLYNTQSKLAEFLDVPHAYWAFDPETLGNRFTFKRFNVKTKEEIMEYLNYWSLEYEAAKGLSQDHERMASLKIHEKLRNLEELYLILDKDADLMQVMIEEKRFAISSQTKEPPRSRTRWSKFKALFSRPQYQINHLQASRRYVRRFFYGGNLMKTYNKKYLYEPLYEMKHEERAEAMLMAAKLFAFALERYARLAQIHQKEVFVGAEMYREKIKIQNAADSSQIGFYRGIGADTIRLYKPYWAFCADLFKVRPHTLSHDMQQYFSWRYQ